MMMILGGLNIGTARPLRQLGSERRGNEICLAKKNYDFGPGVFIVVSSVSLVASVDTSPVIVWVIMLE